MWLTNTIGNAAIGFAAWIQDRYFEPEQIAGNWVVYSHNGTIGVHDELPITIPGSGLWHRDPETENYERMDVAMPSHEPSTPLALPFIQAVVRLPAHSRRHRKSRNKPRDFDITNELARFGGEPVLDWLHVGLCMKHAYGFAVAPGQYELSLIDSELNMHELTEEQAAVFSAIDKNHLPVTQMTAVPLPELGSDDEPDPGMEQTEEDTTMLEEEMNEPEPAAWGSDPWDSDDERSDAGTYDDDDEPDPEMESDWHEDA